MFFNLCKSPLKKAPNLDVSNLGLRGSLIGTVEKEYSEFIQDDINNGASYDLEVGGKLSLQIDKYNMNLKIEMSDIVDTDGWWDKPDIYFIAKIRYYGADADHELVEIHRSEVLEDKEACSFHPFPVACNSLLDNLVIEIFDEDVGADDFIGRAEFSFENILDDGYDHIAVYNNSEELMCNVNIKCVNKLRVNIAGEETEEISEKGECAESVQEVKYQLEGRVERGGFYGKIHILDSLGRPGRWLNNVLFAGKDTVNMCLAENCLFMKNIDTDIIEWVQLFDKNFKAEVHEVNVMFYNLDRRLRIKCETDVDAEELHRQVVEHFANDEEYADHNLDRDEEPIESQSFAKERKNSPARWFNQGRDYYWYLSEVVEKAEKEIYITDWWFSPEVLLKRPLEKYGPEWSIVETLKRKADAGVLVYIQLFSSTGEQMQLKLGAPRVKAILNPHPNIQVLHHGAGADNLFLWSHHEKLCIVDQCVAFVGGIDLCSNRWDDDRYLLLDETVEALQEGGQFEGEFPVEEGMIHGEEGRLWNGKDYTNSFLAAGGGFEEWETDLLDRTTQQRMPWQDIASVVYGLAAWDVARHFIQRWNFTKMQQAQSDDADEFSQIRYLLPAPRNEIIDRSQNFIEIEAEEGREFSHETPVELTVQALRSFGNWSGGVQATEHSIQSTYIDLISNAEQFVYIENQFFVTTLMGNPKGPQAEVANRMGQVLVDRVLRAVEEGDTDFKIYIIIPLMPEFFGDIFKAETEAATLKTIMHYQYASISKDNPEGDGAGTIFTKLRDLGVENPEDYIHFGALRAHQKVTDTQAVTEVIYVHSKLLIVDDKYTVIGSANFNDRSQEGNRDSEFCLKFTDTDETDFAKSLRIRLWSRFIGEDCSEIDPHSQELGWRVYKILLEYE